MTPILHQVYSWAYFFGAASVAVLQHLYWRQQRHYLDKHYPLPHGAKRAVRHISRTWIASAAAALGLGYVLLTASVTHDQTVGLASNVSRCWSEAYQSTRAQIELNAQNDLISRTQQSLQRQFDIDTSNWLKDLIGPPGDLSNRPANDPARQAYGLQRTAQYQGQLDDLGAQFDEQVHQRELLDQKRSQHNLPEVTCGK